MRWQRETLEIEVWRGIARCPFKRGQRGQQRYLFS